MSAPLYNALKEIAGRDYIEFHMPAHRRGQAFGEKLLGIDLTELGETDNLHFPTGIIAEAESLAAAAFGAGETYFLTNGSSCGVMAMCTAAASNGEKIIVDRAAHISVVRALILSGAVPVWLPIVTPEAVGQALKENPEAKAVLVTSPNYYGHCLNLSKISDMAHAHNALMLADEAHGAHFAFSSRLPQTALNQGADVCVQSAHKTLPALTQSAFLHTRKGLNLPLLKDCVRMFQSTSPSYILMAYLDLARDIMQHDGERLLNELIDNIISVFPEQEQKFKDVTRLVFSFKDVSGYVVADKLKEKGIVVEMAGERDIVCIANYLHTKKELLLLRDEISLFPRADYVETKNFVPTFVHSPREAYFKKSEQVHIENANGRIAAQAIALYPPGNPIVIPGEIITNEIINHLIHAQNIGATINGIDNDYVTVLY